MTVAPCELALWNLEHISELATADRNIPGPGKAKSDASSSGFEHDNLDIRPNTHRFTDFSGQYKHHALLSSFAICETVKPTSRTISTCKRNTKCGCTRNCPSEPAVCCSNMSSS